MLFEMTALNLPKFMAVILPIAIFAAILVVYNKLTNDSELVVMRAAGVGQMSLARPGLMRGLLGVFIGFALQLYLVPASTHAFKFAAVQLSQQLRKHAVARATLQHAGRWN